MELHAPEPRPSSRMVGTKWTPVRDPAPIWRRSGSIFPIRSVNSDFGWDAHIFHAPREGESRFPREGVGAVAVARREVEGREAARAGLPSDVAGLGGRQMAFASG